MGKDQKSIQEDLKELTELACRLGANDAQGISTEHISVDDTLVDLCKESRCANYGLSVNCPPHVSGPSGFRELLKDYQQAVVFKIEVPTEILLSEDSRDLFIMLQEIAAAVEQSAVERGYRNSKGFAGGSCKQLFCQDHDECRVLAGEGECLHPLSARPSMSGFGIHVSGLMKAAGWSMDRITRETRPDDVSTGMLCGLVLVG
jgi:predicted metal-binding protein